jgi:hypothetical protein
MKLFLIFSSGRVSGVRTTFSKTLTVLQAGEKEIASAMDARYLTSGCFQYSQAVLTRRMTGISD